MCSSPNMLGICRSIGRPRCCLRRAAAGARVPGGLSEIHPLWLRLRGIIVSALDETMAVKTAVFIPNP